jgi:hypothetical protein
MSFTNLLMYQYYTNKKLPRISDGNDTNHGKVRWNHIKPFIEGLDQILKNSEVIKKLETNHPHFKSCYDDYQNNKKSEERYKKYLANEMRCEKTYFTVYTDWYSISGRPSWSKNTKRPSWFSNIDEPIKFTMDFIGYRKSSSRPEITTSSTKSSMSLGWHSSIKKIRKPDEYKFSIFCNEIFKNLK